MQQVIATAVFTRRGLKRFTADVNALLAQGWMLVGFNVEHRLLRIVCFATVVKK